MGTVNDDRFIVRGKIDGKMFSTRVANYFNKMAPDVRLALTFKLNEEIANDVLLKSHKI